MRMAAFWKIRFSFNLSASLSPCVFIDIAVFSYYNLYGKGRRNKAVLVKVMNVAYMDPGAEYMAESVLMFQSEDEAPFWSDPLYYFYPQLDKEKVLRLDRQGRKSYIDQTIRALYRGLKGELEQKVSLYNDHWKKNKGQIEEALSEAFDTDCVPLFNDLCCRVSLNPVSPRFLEKKYFEVFYRNSERGALGVSLHEIIHFVWFHVWNSLFQDKYEEYERPSMKWILSEMVVESVMADPRLSALNPYFPRENGGCVYPWFFDMKAAKKPVLKVIDEQYRELGIKEFMKSSYAFCLEHEEEIRAHMERAERQS